MSQDKKVHLILAELIKNILSTSFGSNYFRSEFYLKDSDSPSDVLKVLNESFLAVLAGQNTEAKDYIETLTDSTEFGEAARFYAAGIDLIHNELQNIYANDPDFAKKIEDIFLWLKKQSGVKDKKTLAERTWSVFSPEAENILPAPEKAIEDLRAKRRINIEILNTDPVVSPLDEVVFTSNILLTLPAADKTIAELDIDHALKSILSAAEKDDQLYWFDHPIQIGVEAEKNEVLYGLKALNETVKFEKERTKDTGDKKLTCILSASVTHEKLHQVAKPYLESALKQTGKLNHLDLFIFTETETDALIDEILVPAAVEYLGYDREKAKGLLDVLGVDGEYGRHYSFLKAISVFWQTLIDPGIKATFKIDLDQVFPEEILIAETGNSAFEHLCSPLWGATGRDQTNRMVELGMIAGALVNEKDIRHSLFTPDVPLPQGDLSADEFVFYSKLPQAISTQAEMLTRYDSNTLDGRKSCIQRVHVTGGTNGILVDSLRRHRPFTPSFFGRAEDQAYILSALNQTEHRLAYVHKDGLIMRHDKESFTQESIQAAAVGKLVGDYTRILLFSAYARHAGMDLIRIKELLDPFTGCFISKIPITLVYLRFALKAMSLYRSEKESEASEFIENGAVRISQTLAFIARDFGQILGKEKEGWQLYYDILETIRQNLEKDENLSKELKQKAEKLALRCRINPENTAM